MTSEANRLRASGAAQADEEARLAGQDIDTPISVEPEPEADPDPRRHKTIFQSPSLSRMRTEWQGDDLRAIREMQAIIDRRLAEAFSDADGILGEIYSIVREPEIDGVTGHVVADPFGRTVWKKGPNGLYIEDFGRLTRAQRDHYLFMITTRICAWEQRAADLWTEAMVAKGLYEEHFSISYNDFGGRPRGTVDDRRAWAQTEAAEERYFAIFLTALSRKADALVRSTSMLAQRLKDTLA